MKFCNGGTKIDLKNSRWLELDKVTGLGNIH